MKVIILITLLFNFGYPERVEYRKLTWEDFKGKPDAKEVSAGFIANVQCQWILTDSIENGECYPYLECGIEEHRSWTTTNNPYVLSHEQLHVTISALIGNRLKDALVKKRGIPESMKNEIWKLYDDWWKIERSIQDQYDAETSHGRKTTEQARWEKYINEQLKKTL